MDVQYAAVNESFKGIRVLEHPTSFYASYVLQVELGAAYCTAVGGAEVSAMFDDLNPTPHGLLTTTQCIVPVNFMPSNAIIPEDPPVDATAWASVFNLSL